MKVRANGVYALAHPATGLMIVVTPGDPDRDDTDDLVKSFGWAFEPVGVETATAAPGEKRTTRRKRPPKPVSAPEPDPEPTPTPEPEPVAESDPDTPKEGFSE